jgi:hypothetical protein
VRPTAVKGAVIIQEVIIDKAVDNAVLVGLGATGYVPKRGQGHAPIDLPRELGPAFKAYMDANNHKTPLAPEELQPYITTPEQQAALDKFIKALTN